MASSVHPIRWRRQKNAQRVYTEDTHLPNIGVRVSVCRKVSLASNVITTSHSQTKEEREAAKAEKERCNQGLQQLDDEYAALCRRTTRNQHMRKVGNVVGRGIKIAVMLKTPPVEYLIDTAPVVYL